MTPLTTLPAPSSMALLIVAIVLIGVGPIVSHADHCPRRHWFSQSLDACVPCSECNTDVERSIVLRSCQPHQDTVCGTLDELEFEWSLLRRQQQKSQQQRQQQHHQQQEQLVQEDVAAVDDDATNVPLAHRGGGGVGGGGTLNEAAVLMGRSWDWQPSSMAFAAVACVLFVLALVYILYQHAKQWRHMENMERRFDRDVEQLSAQLMHNIVDLRTIETATGKKSSGGGGGGHILIGHEDALLGIKGTIIGTNSGRGSRSLMRCPKSGGTMSAALLLPAANNASGKSGSGGGGFHEDIDADSHDVVDGGVSDSAVDGGSPTTTASSASTLGGDGIRCVYLDQLLAVGSAPIRGNVYTEETKTKTTTTTTLLRSPTNATRTTNAAAPSIGSHSSRHASVNANATANGISASGLHRMQSAFGRK